MISSLVKKETKNNGVVKNEKIKGVELKKEKEKNREIKRDIFEIQRKWQYLMGQREKFNKFNKSFGLNNIICTDYGFVVDIYAPSALHLDELETLKPYIETEFSCEFVYKICYNTNKNKYAEARFINPEKVKCNSIPFCPYKVKPYEFYAGVDISGEPVIFNVNVAPQILLAGKTRRGKNGSLDHAMVSWIHFCSEKEIQFYLFQCAKNDLIKYKDAKQVRCYVEGDLYQMSIVLEHILEEMERRKKLFTPMMAKAEGNDNIFHYNNLHSHEKLPYIYIVIDEFIELMPDNELDGKEVKFLKNTILRYLQSIAQWGGSYGANYIICHQKPEKALCPTFLKNQSSVRLCFGFEDETCCQIVLGAGLAKMAHKLPPRKAFYTDNEKNGYLYTTDLKGKIRPNIEKSIVIGHRTIFDDFKKLGIETEASKKDTKSKDKSQTPPSSTGKENATYEQQLKQKEEELRKKDEKLKKQEENIRLMAIKIKNINNSMGKDVYDKIEKDLNKTTDQLLEENKNKNSNWVPYVPPETGKEIIK
jgi:S-DNA-T family DNA segregation ATPase FtsK/SpoIIIE